MEIGGESAARHAGGMLAPWCERETAEDIVITLGAKAVDWWDEVTPVTHSDTLVVARPRNRAELTHFSRRTYGLARICRGELSVLEPGLSERFAQALFCCKEAHLDSCRALRDMAAKITELGGEICLGASAPNRVDLDCTGVNAHLKMLRPVRGEMVILHCPEIKITRPVWLLHPHIPIYIVPQENSRYMVGATVIESSSSRSPTVWALSWLLSAAYALHPAFAKATVVETGAGLWPVFPDNLP